MTLKFHQGLEHAYEKGEAHARFERPHLNNGQNKGIVQGFAYYWTSGTCQYPPPQKKKATGIFFVSIQNTLFTPLQEITLSTHT